jgi:hypothetical protein
VVIPLCSFPHAIASAKRRQSGTLGGIWLKLFLIKYEHKYKHKEVQLYEACMCDMYSTCFCFSIIYDKKYTQGT